MPIRITGMNSGLDTEAIIKELASAKSYKKTQMEKAQKKLGWKQDTWKALNTKIYNFYTKTLDSIRYQSSFSKKTVTSSNSNAVSVIAGDDAPYSTQTLNVLSLAKAGYMTGGKVNSSTVTDIDGSTNMADLGVDFSGGDVTVDIKIGGVSSGKTLELKSGTTIDDVVKQLQDAGLNANFDKAQGRFYVSSKETGKESDFSLSVTSGDANTLTNLGLDVAGGAHKIDGTDAMIELNGVEYTSKNNVFNINGLTITAKAETVTRDSSGQIVSKENVTLTTENDTSGIYDMIKSFIKDYNTLINEMDKLYNADSAKGYEPLTDEEKDAISDSEAEKWETKIKDSLLRHDSALNSVASAMKEIMSQGVEMSDGKTMYLYDFGIDTLGYFEAADNERNAFHINGDTEDSNVSSKTNTLMAMISSDPEKVTEFFVGLTRNLYNALGEKMASVKDMSSAFTVYNDKQMQAEYDEYTEKIAAQQKKVDAFMDKYYAKFSAMETALARLESKSNAVAQLLGM